MLIVQNNISLKKYNSFGIDVSAKYFAEINSEEDLRQLFQQSYVVKNPVLILGGGSNMLFTQDFDGLIIRINIKGIEHQIENNSIKVKAGAGENWNDLVQYAVAHNFGGLENLSLIPGSVGASPIQNIGAYGVEVKDVFDNCQAYEIETGIIKTFHKNDCKFAYRESIFKQGLKGKYIITSVTFNLSLNADLDTQYGVISQELQNRNISNPSIKDVSEVVSHIRVAKLPDPKTIGNAGSFFKNPIVSKTKSDSLLSHFPDMVYFNVGINEVKLAAGWLIEQCGWKGKIVGNTGTWKNQALVLVNYGEASGKEIFDFSASIIDSVKVKFGVDLEREVNIL